MEFNIVSSNKIFNGNDTISSLIQFSKGHINQSRSPLIKVSSQSNQELIIVDFAIVILIKVLEDSLELRGSNIMSILLQAPLELVPIKLLIPIIVHPPEDEPQASDAMAASLEQHPLHLIQHLVRLLPLSAEHRVHIRVVP